MLLLDELFVQTTMQPTTTTTEIPTPEPDTRTSNHGPSSELDLSGKKRFTGTQRLKCTLCYPTTICTVIFTLSPFFLCFCAHTKSSRALHSRFNITFLFLLRQPPSDRNSKSYCFKCVKKIFFSRTKISFEENLHVTILVLSFFMCAN